MTTPDRRPVGSWVRIREPEDDRDDPVGRVVVVLDAMGQVHVQRAGAGVEIYLPAELEPLYPDEPSGTPG